MSWEIRGLEFQRFNLSFNDFDKARSVKQDPNWFLAHYLKLQKVSALSSTCPMEIFDTRVCPDLQKYFIFDIPLLLSMTSVFVSNFIDKK